MVSYKINLKSTKFAHHRDGWDAATRQLQRLHNIYGINFYDWADKEFKNHGVIGHKWAGILHNVISYPDEYAHKYNDERIYPLGKLVELDSFQQSLENCLGIFTLSTHTGNFLSQRIQTPIEILRHPIEDVPSKFEMKSFARRVVSVGQWLRRYHSFFELKTSYDKVMPKLPGFEADYTLIKSTSNDVRFVNYLSERSYDEMLSSSVVFIDLYDAAACNTLLECIIRNTPILINRLPAVVEYLGAEYPLYFDSLDEASYKLNKIEEAYQFLKCMNKETLKPSHFFDSFYKSNIYSTLPTILL